MKRAFSRVLALTAVLSAAVSTAHAEFVMGVDTAAVLPVSKYKRSVNDGGALGIWGGYGVDATDWLWTGFVLEPEIAVLGADSDVSSQTTSTFILTAGPRAAVHGGNVEFYFAGMGGLYTDMSGPFSGSSGGWNIGGGLNYYLVPKLTSLGVFSRYDSSGLDAVRHSNANREYVQVGLTVQHRFLEAEPAVPAAPAPPPPVAAAPPPAAKKKIVLRGVNFDFDKASLRPEAKPILDDAITTLKENGEVDVTVDGYTDDRGSDAYNLKLSERRAETVAAYLEKGGIARSRLTLKGFGEADPVASNALADGRAQNRRVELRVSD